MKTFLYLFAFSLIFEGYSQKTNIHRIGGGLSPEASYRSMPDQMSFNDVEKFDFGFTAGLTYSYQFRWYCAFETGIYFSSKSLKFDYSQLSFGDQIDPRRGFIYNQGDNPLSNVTFQNYYLEIPVKFNFYLSKSWIKPFIGVGLSNNFYIGSTRNYKLFGTNPNLSVYNLQVMASIGLDMDLPKNFTLRIEPQFKHSLFTINKNAIVKEYPYSIGCMLGFYYRLE